MDKTELNQSLACSSREEGLRATVSASIKAVESSRVTEAERGRSARAAWSLVLCCGREGGEGRRVRRRRRRVHYGISGWHR